jgi:hypothetical protein
MRNLMHELERTVADVRDRTASGLAASSDTDYDLGVVRRAMDRMTERVERMHDDVADDLDHTADRLLDRIDQLADDLSPSRGWFSRLALIGFGAGLGWAAALLLDERAGTERRERLAEQARMRRDELTARVRERTQDAVETARHRAEELTETARARAEEATEAARGAAEHRIQVTAGKAAGKVNEAAGGDAPEDPETLRQKIRSEIIGRMDGTDDVIVAVHAAGRVELKGLVPDRATAAELTSRVRDVAGVDEVTDSLRVGSASS